MYCAHVCCVCVFFLFSMDDESPCGFSIIHHPSWFMVDSFILLSVSSHYATSASLRNPPSYRRVRRASASSPSSPSHLRLTSSPTATHSPSMIERLSRLYGKISTTIIIVVITIIIIMKMIMIAVGVERACFFLCVKN